MLNFVAIRKGINTTPGTSEDLYSYRFKESKVSKAVQILKNC